INRTSSLLSLEPPNQCISSFDKAKGAATMGIERAETKVHLIIHIRIGYSSLTQSGIINDLALSVAE
ncbi:unnamed protein product, partial [Dovyalis caffra]